MRQRLLISLAAAFAFGACSDAPTDPTEIPKAPDFILYGSPDGNDHPYVGLLLFFDADGPVGFCTGSALDANTILTAGHCTHGATAAHWYQMEKPLDAFPTIAAFLQGGIIGTPITYPAFGASFLNTGDVGVVQLVNGTATGPYAELAEPNALADLSKHHLFDIVGYGVEDVRPVQVFNAERLQAQAKLVNAKSGFSGGFNLHLSGNKGLPHRGAVCFGDSGGPVLGGDVVYGVVSFGSNSNNCTGASYAYRVDIEAVHTWIVEQLDD
jgi:hypothetical protein